MSAETTVDSTVDIESLIGEVKSHKEIWNAADENYHDRARKRNAWINICRVFFPSFDEKDEKEKNDLCEKLSKKWRNIKDNFYKSEKRKRSKENGYFPKRYVYARQLSFLKTGGVTPGGSGSGGLERLDRRGATKFTRTIKRQMATDPASSDMSFFQSLLPFIDNFTEDQNLEFRSEVLDLIKRIKSGSTDDFRYQPNVQYGNPVAFTKSEQSSCSPCSTGTGGNDLVSNTAEDST